MALILNETNEVLTATGLSLDWQDFVGAGTLCFWAKLASSGNDAFCSPLALSVNTTRSSGEQLIFRNDTGGTWQMQRSSAATTDTGVTPTADEWRFFAFAKANDGSDKSLYTGNGSGLSEATGAVIANVAFTRITLGRACDSGSGTQFNGKIAHIRVFNARLTDAEVLAEAQNGTPQKTGNLVYAWPLISDLNASTGGVNFTSSAGTATFDSDTPYTGSSIAPKAAYYSMLRRA